MTSADLARGCALRFSREERRASYISNIKKALLKKANSFFDLHPSCQLSSLINRSQLAADSVVLQVDPVFFFPVYFVLVASATYCSPAAMVRSPVIFFDRLRVGLLMSGIVSRADY